MTLLSRSLTASFQLGTGSFGEDGADVNTVSNLRMSCRIQKAGGRAMGQMQLTVFGMKKDAMNRLSTLGMVVSSVRRNTVTVTAGDADHGESTVFIGTIINAWLDAQSAPEVAFRVEAQSGLLGAVQTSAPKSFNGSTTVVSIMASLAQEMGLAFENNGVGVVLQSPYFYGSPRQQAVACVQHAGIEWNGGDNGTLAIWPRGGARGGAVPLISPTTGMAGYPTFDSFGVKLKTLFNPSVGLGSKVQVQSDLTPACGQWVVYNLDYELDAQYPGGAWFQNLQLARPGVAAPVVQ